MDIGRIKNVAMIWVMSKMSTRFLLWAIQTAVCSIGDAMRKKLIAPQDPYTLPVGFVAECLLGSIKKDQAVDFEWLHQNAIDSVGKDLVELNEEARMSYLLTILQASPETKRFFETKN